MKIKPLNNRETRTLKAAAECILPPGGAFELGHADVDYLGWVNREYLPSVPFEVRLLLRVILFLLEYLGWIYAGAFGRFSRLPLEKRNRVFDRVRHSSVYALRGFHILLSTVLLLPFYRDERVMDAIGYRGYKPNANKFQGERA